MEPQKEVPREYRTPKNIVVDREREISNEDSILEGREDRKSVIKEKFMREKEL